MAKIIVWGLETYTNQLCMILTICTVFGRTSGSLIVVIDVSSSIGTPHEFGEYVGPNIFFSIYKVFNFVQHI